MGAREEFIRKKERELGGKRISNQEELEYYRRLIQPYGNKQCFVTQYVNGDGHELESHFWSIRSSSRFAFELYSWMVKDPRVSSFAFEKKLVGIYRAPKVPNMDVYLEVGDRAVFIESKLAEEYSANLDGLPDSYYKDERLSEHYYGYLKDAKKIQRFVLDIKQSLKDKKLQPSWMYYHQEITHLVGIYLTLKRNGRAYRNKNVEFYNVYYDFGDNDPATLQEIDRFFKLANEVFGDLLKDLCTSFTYRHLTAQQLVKEGTILPFDPSQKAFGSDKTISEYLLRYFDFVI